MSNGSLSVAIVLDKPSTHVYCGSQEPITGNVCLRYHLPPGAVGGGASSELFGPLRVTIRLHGRAKTKIKRDKEYDRGRVALFSIARLVYDGPLRMTAGPTPHLLPFAVRFPETVQQSTVQRQAFLRCFDERDGRFNTAPDQPLPPTMSTDYHGFTQSFEAFVEYRLGVAVVMPGLQQHVTIGVPRDEDGPLVAYDRAHQPQPQLLPPLVPAIGSGSNTKRGIDPKPHVLGGKIRVQSKHLLPEAHRPRGFRERTKAALNPAAHYPVAVFGWSFAVPLQVCRSVDDSSATVPVTVRAWPLLEESHAASASAGGNDAKMIMPEIRLLQCSVRVRAHTSARAEIHFVSCHDAEGHEDVAAWSMQYDPTLFRGEAHEAEADNGNGWSKTMGSVRLGPRVPSSFRTVNIARYYRMHITVVFGLPGGETRVFKNEMPLTVLPPLGRVTHTQAEPQSLAPALVAPVLVAEDPIPMYTAALATGDPIDPPAYEDVAKPPKYTAAPT